MKNYNPKLKNIEKELSDIKKDVDSLLRHFFTRKRKQAKLIDDTLVQLVDAISDMTFRGGDRMRPAFCLWGYEACGGKDKERIFPAACALEIFHTFALIHDDIMDKAKIRRGGSTIHEMFKKRLKEEASSVAILAGDLSYSWADELFDRVIIEKKKEKKARILFNQLKEDVTFGQFLDISSNLVGKVSFEPEEVISNNLSEEEILTIYEYKTARYSIEKPLLIGATFAGVNKRVLLSLSQFGVNVGVAFQIYDDILGLFGNEKIVGKEGSSDISEGKRTLLLDKTIEALKERKDRRSLTNLSSLIGRKNINNKEFVWLKKLIKSVGAKEYCHKKAQKLVREGKKILMKERLEGETKKKLLEIADFVIEREY